MKKSVKIILWVVLAVIGIPILIGILAVIFTPGDKNEATTETATEQTEEQKQEPEVKSAWKYETKRNEMDDSTSYYARVKADEELEFDFPYDGGATAYILLMNRSGENDAVLRISKGQFMPSLLDGKITVRFDDQPAKTYRYSDPNDSSNDTIFINDAAGFIEKLKTAKQTLVQCTFFNEGTRTMRFDTQLLKWEH